MYVPDSGFDCVCCKVEGLAAINDEHPKLYELHWLGASVGFVASVGLIVGGTGPMGGVGFVASMG